MYLFLKNLSNPELSLQEFLSFQDMLKKHFDYEQTDKFIVLNTKLSEKEERFIAERLSFNKLFGKVIYKNKELIYKPSHPLRLMPSKNIKFYLELMQKQGFELDRESKNKAIEIDNYVIELLKEVKEKEFEQRKVEHRPGFMPFSLQPRFARTLINLSRAKQNDILLDPFCGIAGICIESCLWNIKSICLERYRDVLEKAYVNNRYYCQNKIALVQGDALSLPFKQNTIDAVVSDLPYGRSTKLTNKHKLYEQALEQIAIALKQNHYAVLMVDYENFESYAEKYNFKLVFKTSFYVHKSLTRGVYVFKLL